MKFDMKKPRLVNRKSEKKKKNGQIEGEQSINNKRLFLFYYDNELNDFVGKWFNNPLLH